MKHVFFALALAFAVPGAAIAQTLPTVKVATTPIDVGAEVLYAKDMGFFQKHGLNVDVQFIDNGAAIASAVASGAIDIAQGNVVTLATAHDKGLPFVVVAPAALYSSTAPTSALIVAANGPVKSAKDLNGKTIGITGVKNITQIAAMAWLDQNGGDSSTVKFIELKFSEMAGYAREVAAARGGYAIHDATLREQGLGLTARLLAGMAQAGVGPFTRLAPGESAEL